MIPRTPRLQYMWVKPQTNFEPTVAESPGDLWRYLVQLAGWTRDLTYNPHWSSLDFHYLGSLDSGNAKGSSQHFILSLVAVPILPLLSGSLNPSCLVF